MQHVYKVPSQVVVASGGVTSTTKEAKVAKGRCWALSTALNIHRSATLLGHWLPCVYMCAQHDVCVCICITICM